MIRIRDASADDLPAILAIYNDVVATSTAIYREEPATLDDRRQWFDARLAQSYPVLVALAAGLPTGALAKVGASAKAVDDDSGILGFASYGDFRAWPGYQFTVEHTIHIRADQRGRGVGTMLMQALVQRAIEQRKHVMIGGVDAANEASLRFHDRLGFVRTTPLRQVGFKSGRWLDLVFVQRLLNEP